MFIRAMNENTTASMDHADPRRAQIPRIQARMSGVASMHSDWLLPFSPVGEAVLPVRSIADGPCLKLSDPAVLAITDFALDPPVTVNQGRQIDDALQDMIRLGVRSLLVYQDQRIVGLITSYDIQGERPMQFLQRSNYSRHQDICVGDIMTPWDQLLGVDWRSLNSASVGDLVRVFAHTELSHLIIIEPYQAASMSILRGLISGARLERRLGGLKLADLAARRARVLG